MENAIESRKDSWTDFESFKYVLAIRLGDFHLEMNAVIKNYQNLMKSETSKDQGTLASFARLIVINYKIFNKPQLIKKMGNYETHKQFFI